MVERKIRPAPLTLAHLQLRQSSASRPSRPRRSASEALRARHQRADARPDEPVPVRGARHLPADAHARGARQQQEGHDRSRAQRAPGEPLPRRARHRARRDRRRHRQGHPARGEVERRGHRPAVPADRDDHDRAAAVARERQGRQPDPRGRHAPRSSCTRSATSSWCRRTSTCGSRRARSGLAAEDYFNDKVLEDTDLLYSGHARAAGGLLGPARQGHGVVAAGRPHLLPPDRAARAVAAASTSSSTRRSRTRRRSTRS